MPLVAYADGPAGPRSSPAAVGMEGAEVLLGWTLEERPWLADGAVRGATVMCGYALAAPVAAGSLRYLPVRLSAVPRLLDQLRPDIGIVTAVRRGTGFALAGSVGWAPALLRSARSVVAEVADDLVDLGGPMITRPIAAVLERPPAPPAPGPRAPDDVDRAIAANVVRVLPDRATLQIGPGGIAEAIVAAVDRPVRIWSGLVTDAVAGLLERGLLDGPATCAYTWGDAGIRTLERAGRLRLVSIDETHDLTRTSAIDRFVACNTALQIGLDGAVNVERAGARVVAGVGGHPDFAAAAARSRAGLSIIALRSRTRHGDSTVVERVDVTSTARCDVDVVVTEHGVADLRGVDDAERACRIGAVAAPEFRMIGAPL